MVNGTHVPIPVNINTVNALFDLDIKTEEEMAEWLKAEQIHYDHPPRNSEEMALSRVGPQLYELIFHPYTKKQWDKEPVMLGPEVTARIPVRNNTDGRYFSDPYQALPVRGYTEIFRNMIRSPTFDGKAQLYLNMDYFKIRDAVSCRRTYYTGPIDTYFADLGWEKLEYRSLNFERQVVKDVDFYQQAFVVNHPSAEINFTRIVEYKHLPGQQKSNNTVIFIERSSGKSFPFFWTLKLIRVISNLTLHFRLSNWRTLLSCSK